MLTLRELNADGTVRRRANFAKPCPEIGLLMSWWNEETNLLVELRHHDGERWLYVEPNKLGPLHLIPCPECGELLAPWKVKGRPCIRCRVAARRKARD